MLFARIPKAGWVGLALGMVLTATILFVGSETVAQQRAFGNRSWTCHASIEIQGYTHPAYVPVSWPMNGTIASDREFECRKHILATWFGTSSIWSLLNLPPSTQSAICAAGSGIFKITYGFDERRRDWVVRQPLLAPPCNCPVACPAGYNMDYTGRRCDRSLCSNVNHPNQNFIDASNNGVFIWSGTLYQMVPATPSGGACTFR